jgi:ABC-type multidrug transport system fused ATPase/permease subunit
VTNIRTVASFGNEDILLGFLNDRHKIPESLISKKSNYAGLLAFGFSQIMMFIIYGIIFYLGAVFNREYGSNMRDVFAAIFAIMYTRMGAGSKNQFMMDVGQAKNAAKNIFKILESQDEFQIKPKESSRTQLFYKKSLNTRKYKVQKRSFQVH